MYKKFLKVLRYVAREFYMESHIFLALANHLREIIKDACCTSYSIHPRSTEMCTKMYKDLKVFFFMRLLSLWNNVGLVSR